MGIDVMVKTTIEINDDLDKRFRDAVVKKKGFKKGILSEAYEEAIEDLIKKYLKEGQGKGKDNAGG